MLSFQGKSALWSHLLQFQDREEKQEHLTDSPGKKVLDKVDCFKSHQLELYFLIIRQRK
jgi:hypothetical protein